MTIQESSFENNVTYIDNVLATKEFMRTPNIYGYGVLTLFPYSKLKEDVNMQFSFGRNNNSTNIEGFKIIPGKKQIKINLVALDIRILENDTIFKLSKTIYSRGKSLEDAEEKLEISRGWFRRFKERSCLHNIKVQSKAASDGFFGKSS